MSKNIKFLLNIITLIIMILLIFFVYYGINLGIFASKETMASYINQFGYFGIIVFLFTQIIQVVFPIIPGGASCVVGILCFGGTLGFILNYLGIVIGSIISFILSRKYGMKIIGSLFKEKDIEKYGSYLNSQKFNLIFFLVILIPGLPDDLMCYVAGLSKMSFKQFVILLILGKPLMLLIYSYALDILPIIP